MSGFDKCLLPFRDAMNFHVNGAYFIRVTAININTSTVIIQAGRGEEKQWEEYADEKD